MKKWLYRIFWIPLFVLAVLFLVANRQLVAISLDPFNASSPAVTSLALPLWLWLALMLFLGVGLGAAGIWQSGAARRQKAHQEHRELKALRREMADANRHVIQSPEGKPHDATTTTAAPKVGENEPPLLESVSAP
ncbi:MAG: hypothetical protein GXP04_15015 [Alphaproteobacteria bacterium]|nr:hypothetical protein [Marinicaulis sp.]NOX96345.1 hypothetical protein [Alphaproteobacteria bacterium]